MTASIKPKDDERPPEHVSVEMSPALYRAIMQILEMHGALVSAEELRGLLERHLSDSIARTVTEVTGVETPFPQGVEVELQIAAPTDEIDDDDDAIRESLKQGL